MQQKRVALKDLKRTINQDLKKFQGHLQRGLVQTAELGKLVVYANAPTAFGDLRGSISVNSGTRRNAAGQFTRQAKGAQILIDAPHAAAAEVGSRPHRPPIAPLIEWVKLRGAQALDAGAGARGKPARVARSIAAHGNGSSTPIDAAERVAWAIANAIAKYGTKPTWFVARSLPDIEKILHAQMGAWAQEKV